MRNFISVSFILLFVTLYSPWVHAQETVTLKVSGLVCSFCAQGIRKSFEKTGAIESIDVDLDNHKVMLQFQSGKSLSDSEILNALESSGYHLVEVQRSESTITKEKEQR